jgi:predicted AAA+ superfamily ATPase
MGRLLKRTGQIDEIRRHIARVPVVGILGPRQVGKTTLARQVASAMKQPVTWFDLESPEDVARLSEPGVALRELSGLVVIDEVQRRPELFPLLRVLADRPKRAARFLVLGSASPDLLRQGSETLAGRIHWHEVGGFSLAEVGAEELEQRWLRGGFPLAFLAADGAASFAWRLDFVRTFLERELPDLGFRVPATTLRRFWTMLAHYHGQTWNASELGRAFGTSDASVRRYLDLLTSTFVVRQLLPWHENLSKRQVKAPKVYLADSGLLHALLGLRDREALLGHPKVGASWEGFVLNEVLTQLRAEPEEAHYWATYAGSELDLLVVRGRQRLGFEFKRTEAPRISPSMRSALADLRLDELTVLHAGEKTFPLAERVRAVAARHLLDEIEPLA